MGDPTVIVNASLMVMAPNDREVDRILQAIAAFRDPSTETYVQIREQSREAVR